MKNFEDFKYVKQKMEQEGFDYCFMCYSNFEEIDDKEFHKLRKEYIKAHKKLKKYIEEKTKIFL